MKNSRTSMHAPLIEFRASLMFVSPVPLESLTTALQKQGEKQCVNGKVIYVHTRVSLTLGKSINCPFSNVDSI